VRLYEHGDGVLEPVSMVDAFPPGSSLGTWYDEMLIHGDTIVVVGYSYQVGATELGLFSIDDEGTIRHRSTYFLRSNDYYSSRNYASRLVDGELIIYMPYYLLQYDWQDEGVDISMPALRAHAEDGQVGGWSDIVASTDVYRPVQPTLWPTLHTVVTCDLDAAELGCTARGILGPYARTFYVSADAVYLWVTDDTWDWQDDQEVEEQDAAQQEPEPNAMVYRFPLHGEPPAALRVHGTPTDQFSFKQSDDDHLNVLVRAHGYGDTMWAPEVRAGQAGLLRTPLDALSARPRVAPAAHYTTLPTPEGYTFTNRFVGDHVLYGTGSSWWGSDPGREDRVYVHPYRDGGETTTLDLPHGVDRIEVMGDDAVVIGTDGQDLHFSSVALGEAPAVVDRYTQEHAQQGELRSHGFFHKPLSEDEGVLGLPVRLEGPGYAHLFSGSAEVLFLRTRDNHFERLGGLAARPEEADDDQCLVSCVDWYGNARPIFYRGRTFALLGYELVEGTLGDQEIAELQRTDFLAGVGRP